MNHYPAWKNALIIAIILIGGLFATPNLFDDDFAVQVSASRQAKVDLALMSEVEAALKAESIDYKRAELDGERLLVRFADAGTQLQAKEVINKFVKSNRREVSIDYIQKVVSDYFQMDIQTLQSKTRKRHIVQARQIAMYFAKKFTKASLASIGSQIGRRDHATVLHACKTVDNLSFTDKQFRKYVEDLNQKLSN